MDMFRVFLVCFSRRFGLLFLSFRSRKFVTTLSGILRSFGVFILIKSNVVVHLKSNGLLLNTLFLGSFFVPFKFHLDHYMS